MSINWSGSGKDKLNLTAGIWEKEVKPDTIRITPLWICLPQARVTIKMLQTENKRDAAYDVEDDS